MYNVSTKYKTEIKKASRSFECRITIGDKIFTNEDILDLKLDSNIQLQDGFMIGSTTSTTLDITLLNKGETIYSNNQIKLEIGLKIGSEIDYIPMGLYNVDDVEKTEYTIKFTAFDNMIKFESAYFSNLGDTATLQQVVNELATKTGVQFTGSLPSYTVKKLEGFTCREILSYVASVSGGNAVITRDGKFTIIVPEEIDCAINGDNYFDYSREEVKYKIGKVTCQVKDKEVMSKGSLGTDSMELMFENPWVTDSILTDIYNKLKVIEYLGYTMKWQGDLSLDIGDIITVTDVKGVVRQAPVLSQKLTYTGGLTSEISAKGESKNKNSFSSSGSTNNKVDRVVTDLAIVNKAFVDYAQINNADIKNLKADTAKIGNLEAETANINNLLAGNITAGSTQTIHLTGKNVVIDEAVIKDLIAKKITVADLIAGNIDTNKFNIVSTDGGISIVGATQQFKDKNNKVRLQIGQDAQGNFNFILKGADGTTTLIDHTGIKENAIANDLIKENMVAENAIGEKQINYSSLVTGINKDTNTQLIKASKVAIDLEGQKLDVAFNTLKTTVDNTKVGGRNYAIDTGTARTLVGNNTTNQTSIIYDIDCTKVKRKECTISFDWEVTEGAGTGKFSLQTGNNHYQQLTNQIDVTLKKGHNTLTKVITDNANRFEHIEIRADNLIGTVKISNLKLEIGNKETDWTPAPEDIQNQMVNPNLIPNSSFNLDNLKIINKPNYIIEGKGYKGYNVLKLNNTTSSNNGVYIEIPSVLDAGKYTLSAYMKLPSDFPSNSKFRVSLWSKVGTIHHASILATTEKYLEWTRDKIEFTLTSQVTDGRVYIQIYDGIGLAQCTMLKLEKGSLTDWSPALEDITEVTNNLQTKISASNGEIETLIKDTTIEESGTKVKLKDAYSTFKQTQDNFNIGVTNKQSEFNEALTIKEQTKLNGIEIFDQRYTSDLGARPFTNSHERYEIVQATVIAGGGDYMPNLIKHKDGGSVPLFFTEFIPVTNFDNPFYGSLDVLYPENTEGGVYLQVGFFDKDFLPVATNDAAMNLVSNKPVPTIDTWHNFNGFVEIPKGDFRRKSAYIRFRVAVRYNGKRKDAYIRNISVKQLGGANLAGLNTTVIETKSEVANIKVEKDKINLRVESNYAKSEQEAQGLRCGTVKLELNKSGLTTASPGELYIHGVNRNSDGIESDTSSSGSVMFSGKTYTIASGAVRGAFEKFGTRVVYLCKIGYGPENSAESLGIYWDETLTAINKWKYKGVINNTSEGNLDMSKILLCYGVFKMRSTTEIDFAYLYPQAKTISEAVSGGFYEARLSSAEQKITSDAIISTVSDTITSSKNEAVELAKAISEGKMLYTDPTFKTGMNGIKLYNNSGGQHVTVNRVSKVAGCPSNSSHCIEIKTTGATTSPGIGGFYFGNSARANAIFITKIVAKIPVGSKIIYAGNSAGTGSIGKWLSNNIGTGKWEEYIYKLTCGDSGDFSSVNYFYIDKASLPLTWYLASGTVYDLRDITDINNRIETAEQQITPTAIVNSISSGINGGSTLNTVSTTLDKNGLTVKNGGIKVKNKSNTDVMWVDTAGYLATNRLNVIGSGNNTVTFGGNGAKSINLKSDDSKDIWMNFLRGNDSYSRIGVYEEAHRSFQLFIEPGSNVSAATPMVIMRGSKSTVEANQNCTLSVIGEISASKDIMILGHHLVKTSNIGQARVIWSESQASNYYIEISNGYGGSYPNLGITVWTSDAYTKKNIDYTKVTALDKIMAIEHAEFDYIKGGNRKLGVVAQQLELVEPSWVLHIPQTDENGDINGERIQPIAHEMIPYITKAMQEQQEEINSLKYEIQQLKEIVKALAK